MVDIIASPSVRVRAAERGIDLEERAKALGRTTICKEDLESGAVAPVSAGQPGRQYWDVDHSKYGEIEFQPLGSIDKIAAANLTAAQALIPAVTHHENADIRKLERFRASLKDEAVFRGVKLSALAFYVKALCAALRAFPKFNASLSADGETLVLKKYFHIGIAVDTPHGLMVPVLRNADQLSVWEIARHISKLATRAQKRKIRPEEMGGASMTISNLGGIGGSGFSPIVNPPEVAILGLTRTQTHAVWENGVPVPVPMLPMDLSYDHRVINGADAARFSRYLADLLKNPDMMVIAF